jgi:uncharacterized membrane protein
MTDTNTVLYAAVYDDVNAALADLDAVDELHKDQMIGSFDAAVIDKELGEPHIVKRVDHPTVRVIPEWFGGGQLPRKELHDAAEQLKEGSAALIVIGEPTLEQGFDRAVTRATKTVKQSVEGAKDTVANEFMAAMKDDGSTKA